MQTHPHGNPHSKSFNRLEFEPYLPIQPMKKNLICFCFLTLLLLQACDPLVKSPSENPEKKNSTKLIKSPKAEKAINQPLAQWMSGKWGIGWRFLGGPSRWSKKLDVNKLVEQIQTIPNVSYVLFNISSGADGSTYTAPHSILSKINPGSCPERDLFGEAATAFQAAGYKVLVYMATQGPAKLKHGPANETDAKRMSNWRAWVKRKYGSDEISDLKKAYAEVIVREYAQRYGTKIDGWWFDHAAFGDIELIHKEIKKANPNAIAAFCRGMGEVGNKSPGYEDYTGGHPAPMRHEKASSMNNLGMVTAIEKSERGFFIKDGKASLGHMFMPTKELWNNGKNIVWTEEQAVDWMQRVLNAGGAWTWNVPLDDKLSTLDVSSVEFMKRVSSKLQ